MSERHDFPIDVGRVFVQSLIDEVAAWREAFTKRMNQDESPAESHAATTDDDAYRAVVTALVEAALFSSMATEEGRTCQPSLVWAPTAEKLDGEVCRFKKSVPLHVDVIRKLAPLCVVGETFLVVAPDGTEIVGTFKPRPTRNLLTVMGDESVRVYAPRSGIVIAARGQREVVRYEHGHIVQGPGWPFLRAREPLASITDGVLGSGSAERLAPFLSEVLLRVLVELRRLQCGGIVAVLGPDGALAACADECKELEEPLPLGRHARTALSTIDNGVHVRGAEPTAADYKRAIDEDRAWTTLAETECEVARLASVDGAVVLSNALDVLAFAAKLKGGTLPTIHGVNTDGEVGEVYPLDRRGMRHRAAATFAASSPGRIVFMVSQDGGATIFFGVDGRTVAWPVELPYQK